MMIFVGTTRAQLEAWRAGAEAGATGFGATAAMTAAHGYGPQETEDAEYAALRYAGVSSLLFGPRRWVVAAEVREVVDAGSPYGSLRVAALRWRDVRALFTDETEALDDVSALARSVLGRPIDDLLADAAVLDAADEHDLLWYSPEELDRVA